MLRRQVAVEETERLLHRQREQAHRCSRSVGVEFRRRENVGEVEFASPIAPGSANRITLPA
ncbi:hypothetical protein RRF57_000249 [Xylaria bambusicola]|uniref:Uncharacterized protein n=1 Tax=Xylaria bambusicola TaxID=326684 RepID=A0AAN7Z2C3_9PEZI